MIKQEEIRRWFCKYLAQFNGNLNYDRLPQYRKDSYKMMVEEDIMPYLHSQGVCIKVDDYLFTQFNSQNATVEPLIDGGKG